MNELKMNELEQINGGWVGEYIGKIILDFPKPTLPTVVVFNKPSYVI